MKTSKVMQTIDAALSHSNTTSRTASALRFLRRYLDRGRDFCEPGTRVLNRDASQEGTATGGTRPCTMEGCTGIRIAVRWPDGKLTYPCSKGMDRRHGKHHIK